MTTETMTDLITAEEAQRFLHSTESGPVHWAGLEYFREYARAVIALRDQLADAEAATAAVVERACLAVSERADWPEDEHGRTEQPELFVRVINAIRAIAHPSGPAMLAELRARAEKAEAERVSEWNKRRDADASRDVARAVCDAMRADRDRLAAANAVLEAKVAGLRAAFRVNMLRYGPPGTSHEEINAAIDAALASGKPGEAGE